MPALFRTYFAICLLLFVPARSRRYAPKRTCHIGTPEADTGIDMDDDALEKTSLLGSSRTKSAHDCAAHCCARRDCSLSWFINLGGGGSDNCFILNCDAPHQCRLKDTGLRNSVTFVHRTTHRTKPTMAPTTENALTSILAAVETSENLSPAELKSLVSSVTSLDDDDKIKLSGVIDQLLDGYKKKTKTTTKGTAKTTTTTTTTATTTPEMTGLEEDVLALTSDDAATNFEPSLSVESTTTSKPTTKKKTTKTAKTTTTTPTTTTTTTTQSPTPSSEKTEEVSKPAETTIGSTWEIVTKSSNSDLSSTTYDDGSDWSTRPPWMQPREGADAGVAASRRHQLQPPPIHFGLLLAASIFGVLATVLTLILMQARIRKAWRRKDYVDADYLINGMYQPNI